MWLQKASTERKGGGNGLVAVAIDRDKGSQYAIRWAIEHLLLKGQTLILIHVVHKSSSAPASHHSPVTDANETHKQQLEKQTKDLFTIFHCLCVRKDVKSFDVALEDTDVVRALVEYVSYAAIENLVLGASSRHGFIRRFKMSDIPSNVAKAAPDFCTVYVISKGKISSVRNASRIAPFTSPLHEQLHSHVSNDVRAASPDSFSFSTVSSDHSFKGLHFLYDYMSPFARSGRLNTKMCRDQSFAESDTDISFVSSGRPSSDRTPVSFYDYQDSGRTPRLSTSSDRSFGSIHMATPKSMECNTIDYSNVHDFSMSSLDSGLTSSSSHSQSMEDMEAEMRRLKLELKQTMEMYSTACKEALTAQQQAMELHRWRLEEERRLEEARHAEEAALALVEREKANCKAAIESAEASRRIAELEAQRRISVEMKILGEQEGKTLPCNDVRYRKYTIEEIEAATKFFSESLKIGEGGYGPVFKCYLDHTPVAVKVLRPDAAQGRAQFQQEVQVLSCIRHPNMVLLLGACPEYGCLVYEYMANGSLDDRLFRRSNTPPLSWQLRFKIACEIATALHFLHQTKPEPIVHRDLKPANILLDNNFVSKISDVGLARLVPPSVADDVTQYRMTSAAGTFCYIDPEYQQTGMLGVKSDVYSLGIMLLQMITAKPAMGLAHHVGVAMDNGTFAKMLDPSVEDWPVEEAQCLAKIAVQCSELRRKDRPDLGNEVLPELERLRDFAEEKMEGHHFPIWAGESRGPSPSPSRASNFSQLSASQEMLSNPSIGHSGAESANSQSNCSLSGSFGGKVSNVNYFDL
ncbi:Non-specific serine/threonine protein kinase [Bertholletia excelsa]